MSQSQTQSGTEVHVQAVLEACAGLTLACAYSSSDEYEAELIQARRKAGAYGSGHRRQAFAAFAVAAAMAVAVFLVF